MVIVANNDAFQVRLVTMMADYDRETICNLYQPLVGYEAVSLYFTLWGEANNQRLLGPSTHDSLFAKMRLSTGNFIKARKALEAVGLIKTTLETLPSGKTFYYDIYAPKTPTEFFGDTLLYGLLIKFIGESDAKKLSNLYQINVINHGEDISASFKEVFNPNFEDAAFLKALENAPKAGRNRASISLEFSYDKFFTALAGISQINDKAFSKKELSEIVRLTSLYGSTEEKAAEIVANNYDPSFEKGKRCDLVSITKAFQEETNYAYMSSSFSNKNTTKRPNVVSSGSALASKINIMESISPKDWLSILQGGSQPALNDLRLIDSLSSQFRLGNAVLNVVIDYCLGMNDNILTKGYMEKICASIAREGITTAIDAMNYLKKITNRGRKVNHVDVHSVVDQEIEKEKIKTQEDEGPGWDELLEDIDADLDGGKNNGKA